MLVVDDDDELVYAIVTALSRDGHDASGVTSAAAARAAVAGGGVDVALVDLLLPDVAGVELVADLARSVRVVVLSGDSSRAAHESAIEGGATDFLVKPVPLDRIREAVIRPSGAPPPP